MKKLLSLLIVLCGCFSLSYAGKMKMINTFQGNPSFGSLAVTGNLSVAGQSTFNSSVTIRLADGVSSFLYENTTGKGIYFLDNEINTSIGLNSDETSWINYRGYASGNSRSRTLNIGDGRANAVLTVNGITDEVLVNNNLFSVGGSTLVVKDGHIRIGNVTHGTGDSTNGGAIVLEHAGGDSFNNGVEFKNSASSNGYGSKIYVNGSLDYTAIATRYDSATFTDRLKVSHANGDVTVTNLLTASSGYFDGDCSALTFTDRTSYTNDKKVVWDSINSMEALPNGDINCDKLNPYIRKPIIIPAKYGENKQIVVPAKTINGRNLTESVSVHNEAIKDLLDKIEALKVRISALENK